MFGSAYRWRVFHEAVAKGREWFYGDHAYFGRFEYFRATRNAYQHNASGDGDPERFKALGLQVQPWRTDGGHILLCPNSPQFFVLHGMNAQDWVKRTTQELRRHTDRPILVRFKTAHVSFEESLKGAWALVVFTSVCGVHAAMAGIPCFATHPCASRSFGTDDLSRIETPRRPGNRYEMACSLAANQWTLPEITAGMAWERLHEHETVARLDPA